VPAEQLALGAQRAAHGAPQVELTVPGARAGAPGRLRQPVAPRTGEARRRLAAARAGRLGAGADGDAALAQ
jgi:hypothetical protein